MTFDEIHVINLDTRPQRMGGFMSRLAQVGDWPWPPIDRFSAVDGWQSTVPLRWTSPGAYGCWASHYALLRSAVDRGVDSMMIFEDDADLQPDFNEQLERLLGQVPTWEALYLGGEHLRRPIGIYGALRCRLTVRTHAYAVRGQALLALVDELEHFRGHYPHDWAQGLLLSWYRTYAPTQFFVGQVEGHSDITNKDEPRRRWDLP